MTRPTFTPLTGRMSAITLACLPLTAFASQDVVDQLTRFNVSYAIVDNRAPESGFDCSSLGADWGACNRAVITLTNPGGNLSSKDWTIWFHSIRRVLTVESDQFKITHVTGDLHKLEPTDHFKGFPRGEPVSIPIISEYWQLFQTDVMPRWYATSSDARPKVIAMTDTEDLERFVAPIAGELWKRTKDDANILMTPESRFQRNADIAMLPTAALRGQIIPTPLEVTLHAADVDLSHGVALELSALDRDMADAVEHRFTQLGVKLVNHGYPIRVTIDPATGKGAQGGYTLSITTAGASIASHDRTGAFHGLQSVLSLIPSDGAPKIATLDATDAPRFAYRGVELDVSRNFVSKPVVLRLLDQMAAYKLNKFHFHMSDDEGWRVEIPGLPELTQIGSKRCHDPSETQCLLPQLGSGPDSNNAGSGHYTRTDYIEIVQYAKARGIEVIPEFDMPAHARAAVVAMEARHQRLRAAGNEAGANEYRLLDPTDTSNTTSVQFYDRRSYLNPCLESSKRFARKVIFEVAKMHVEAGQPLAAWHFGGDEAKNIRLGGGFQDRHAEKFESWKGTIDQTREDKPWAKSLTCQKMIANGAVADLEHLPSHFAVEISKLVAAQGIGTMQAWQDGLKDAKDASTFATRQVAVNFWDTLYWGGSDAAADWAGKGYRVVVSNPDYVYMDFPYEVNPAERGYYWASRFNDERKMFGFAPDNLPQNAETSLDRDGKTFAAKSDKPWPGALGLSAQSWGESIRTDAQREYMIFPRLIAVAERAWHRAAWELPYVAGREFKHGETAYVDQKARTADWQRFANLLGQRELAKLDRAGIGYRLPQPGARISNGLLEANTALPGITIEYSTDGGSTWHKYAATEQPAVNGDVLVRSASPDGKRHSRIEAAQ